MYNKLFTKILDSSIWLESMPTRIVWLTLIATMDEQGFAQFAAIGNVANRARVTLDEARAAIECLESPDKESGDPSNEGRRIERVPGGWIVLNAEKHREMVTRAIVQEQTRERVRRHRALKRAGNATVTASEARSGSEASSEEQEIAPASAKGSPYSADFDLVWTAYPRKTGKGAAWKAFSVLKPDHELVEAILTAIGWQVHQPGWREDGGKFIPHFSTWLRARRWEDEPFHSEAMKPAKTDWWAECKRLHGLSADGTSPACAQASHHRARLIREGTT